MGFRGRHPPEKYEGTKKHKGRSPFLMRRMKHKDENGEDDDQTNGSNPADVEITGYRKTEWHPHSRKINRMNSIPDFWNYIVNLVKMSTDKTLGHNFHDRKHICIMIVHGSIQNPFGTKMR